MLGYSKFTYFDGTHTKRERERERETGVGRSQVEIVDAEANKRDSRENDGENEEKHVDIYIRVDNRANQKHANSWRYKTCKVQTTTKYSSWVVQWDIRFRNLDSDT